MNNFRTVIIFGIFGSILGAGVAPAYAQRTLTAAPLLHLEGGQHLTTYVQFRRHGFGRRGFGHRGFARRGFYGRPHYGRRFYGRPYYRRGYGSGALIGGLAAGALVGGALAAQAAPGPVYVAPSGGNQVAYCQQRFRSYDPASGTYLGYDGKRHPCP